MNILKFKVEKIKPWRKVRITISRQDVTTWISLTYGEWNSLLKFLKKTKNKKFLPKGALQYAELDMSDNKYHYTRLRSFYKKSPVWKEMYALPPVCSPANTVFEKRMKKRWERYVKTSKQKDRTHDRKLKEDAKKNPVAKKVYFYSKDYENGMGMQRKQFKKFREYCLNPDNAEVVTFSHQKDAGFGV